MLTLLAQKFVSLFAQNAELTVFNIWLKSLVTEVAVICENLRRCLLLIMKN